MGMIFFYSIKFTRVYIFQNTKAVGGEMAARKKNKTKGVGKVIRREKEKGKT